MDWITQSKFRNWLLVVLVASNLLTVSIIWMQTAKTNEPQRKEQGPRASESVNLMKKVLDLDEGQIKQVENNLAARREQSKKYNDRMSVLKRQLADELFKDNPDTSSANVKAKEIGELQSKVELIRFNHFQELLAICTPEQKEKLKPVVIEVFGRKPPKDEQGERKEPRDGQEEKPPRERKTNGTEREHSSREGNRGEAQREKPQTPRDGKPEPPSVDEKLARYSERLNLTKDQERQVREVLLKTRQHGEELRTRTYPDQDVIEAEKTKIRREEDESILAILNDDQKAIFIQMISRRKQ